LSASGLVVAAGAVGASPLGHGGQVAAQVRLEPLPLLDLERQVESPDGEVDGLGSILNESVIKLGTTMSWSWSSTNIWFYGFLVQVIYYCETFFVSTFRIKFCP
jgi:hypothetical protein